MNQTYAISSFALSIIATGVGNLGIADWVLVIGAVMFAIASLRNARMKVLRDTNQDLATRTKQLETKNASLEAENKRLHAQSSEVLAELLGKQGTVLERLVDRLESHDRNVNQSVEQLILAITTKRD